MAKRAIYFDTETTGTNPQVDRIIEIAAYDATSGTSFERLINPGIAIPHETIMIHQISDSMVQDAPAFEVVAREFFEFCSGDVALIAHNADAFDVPFLRAECKRCSLELPAEWLFIDSLKWSRRYRKDLPRHSLQFLRQTYGIQLNQAHRALNDVMTLYEVFSAMTDDLTCEAIGKLLQANKIGAANSLVQSPAQSVEPIQKPPEMILQLF